LGNRDYKNVTHHCELVEDALRVGYLAIQEDGHIRIDHCLISAKKTLN
jgi:hypothetical protein